MKAIRAGRMRQRITLQTVTENRGVDGSITSSWADTATVWAVAEPLEGREYWAAQQVNAERTTKFRIRYRSGVVPKMRVSYDSRTFDIVSVVNVEERDRELVLMCEEVVG